VAKEKIFDRNVKGENSIQAVERSNIWDFMLYLSKKKADNKFINHG